MDQDIFEGIKLITAKYSSDICGFRNMDLTDFYDPETFSLVYSSVFGIKEVNDGQLGDKDLCYLMTLYPEPLALVLITSELVFSFPTEMLRIQSQASLVEN